MNEGLTNFDKAVLSNTESRVLKLLEADRDRVAKTAGNMWPGEEKYWAEQALGTINAVIHRSLGPMNRSPDTIRPYYNSLVELRKKLATYLFEH